jgi:hypothetical protein
MSVWWQAEERKLVKRLAPKETNKETNKETKERKQKSEGDEVEQAVAPSEQVSGSVHTNNF